MVNAVTQRVLGLTDNLKYYPAISDLIIDLTMKQQKWFTRIILRGSAI